MATTPPPAPSPRPKRSLRSRFFQTFLPAVAAIALLAWWVVYGQRTKWELHREGASVYLAGESETTVKMMGSNSSVRVTLSVGCENGKEFIHLGPVPVLPIGESGGKPYSLSIDEMFYAKRGDRYGSHIVRNTSWETIPPSITLLERLDEPATDPVLGQPSPQYIPSSAPRFVKRLSGVELYVLDAGPIDLPYGTSGFKEHLPELMSACGWQ